MILLALLHRRRWNGRAAHLPAFRDTIPKTTNDMKSAFVMATVGLLALGTRLPGLFTDFWVDEVWSLSDVLALESWTDIFLTLRIDNNHHLNSAWLFLLGSGQHAALYRLPAFVAGLGSVVIAWRIGARDGRLNGGLTALVFAWSFPLAYYSSEARGYAIGRLPDHVGPLVAAALLRHPALVGCSRLLGN